MTFNYDIEEIKRNLEGIDLESDFVLNKKDIYINDNLIDEIDYILNRFKIYFNRNGSIFEHSKYTSDLFSHRFVEITVYSICKLAKVYKYISYEDICRLYFEAITENEYCNWRSLFWVVYNNEISSSKIEGGTYYIAYDYIRRKYRLCDSLASKEDIIDDMKIRIETIPNTYFLNKEIIHNQIIKELKLIVNSLINEVYDEGAFFLDRHQYDKLRLIFESDNYQKNLTTVLYESIVSELEQNNSTTHKIFSIIDELKLKFIDVLIEDVINYEKMEDEDLYSGRLLEFFKEYSEYK